MNVVVCLRFMCDKFSPLPSVSNSPLKKEVQGEDVEAKWQYALLYQRTTQWPSFIKPA